MEIRAGPGAGPARVRCPSRPGIVPLTESRGTLDDPYPTGFCRSAGVLRNPAVTLPAGDLTPFLNLDEYAIGVFGIQARLTF